jgi:hypothetical protein
VVAEPSPLRGRTGLGVKGKPLARNVYWMTFPQSGSNTRMWVVGGAAWAGRSAHVSLVWLGRLPPANWK